MYVVRVYNDYDVLVDVAGEFDTECEANQWVRDYVPDGCYAVVVRIDKER